MAGKTSWGEIKIDPGNYVMHIHEGVITWHYKPPRDAIKRKPVPTGQGEYANRSEGHKLYSKARRRISKFSLQLYSIGEPPSWLITFNYPNKQARSLAAEDLKADLQCFRKFVRQNYPDLGVGYLIDWSQKAKHHIHLLVWGSIYKTKKGKAATRPICKSKRIARTRFAIALRKWWANRVSCKKRNLTDVSYLPETEDGIRARNYLITESKTRAHMKVVALLGKRHGFGFFNKKRIPFLPTETFELSEEEFDEVRRLCLADAQKSKGVKNSSQKHHKDKLRKARAYRHVCHDRKLSKKLKSKLRRRRED